MSFDDITLGVLTSPSDMIDLDVRLRVGDLYRPGSWAFRGQPQKFGTLVPSFQRTFTGKKSPGTAKIIEADLIKAFREHYAKLQATADMPMVQQIAAGLELQCLSVMQHYGVPTRLLDWTADFWTAVYFACAGDPGTEAELWFYDREMFSTAYSDVNRLPIWLSPALAESDPAVPDFLDAAPKVLIGELDPKLTPRMRTQSAHHTVSTDVFADHAPLLKDLSQSVKANDAFKRVVISSGCKEKALRFLEEHKKITAGTVFPDVEGLGRFLRWHLDTLKTMLL